MEGLALLSGGVQQGLQQSRPVSRLHQGGKILRAAVQQLPPAPAGERTKPGGEGQTPDSRPAQFQGQHGSRQVLRQKTGVFRRGLLPQGVQNAGGHAVQGLITGDGDFLIQRRGVEKGGRRSGKGHLTQRFKGFHPPGRKRVGKPLFLQRLHGQAQQGGCRRVGKTADDVHHFSLPVGNHLSQHKGDAAVPKGLCKLIQMLCHGGASLLS